MRVARSLILLVFVMVLCGLLQKARGAELEVECLSSPAEVIQLHPGARPIWSVEIRGHVGEKCWFPKEDWMRMAKAKVATKRHHVQKIASKPAPKPNTEELKQQFFRFLRERYPDDFGWLTRP